MKSLTLQINTDAALLTSSTYQAASTVAHAV